MPLASTVYGGYVTGIRCLLLGWLFCMLIAIAYSTRIPIRTSFMHLQKLHDLHSAKSFFT